MLSNKALLVIFLAVSGVLTPDGRGTGFATAKPFVRIFGDLLGLNPATQPPSGPISVIVSPVNSAQYRNYAQPTGQQFPTMPQQSSAPNQQQEMQYQNGQY